MCVLEGSMKGCAGRTGRSCVDISIFKGYVVSGYMINDKWWQGGHLQHRGLG